MHPTATGDSPLQDILGEACLVSVGTGAHAEHPAATVAGGDQDADVDDLAGGIGSLDASRTIDTTCEMGGRETNVQWEDVTPSRSKDVNHHNMRQPQGGSRFTAR